MNKTVFISGSMFGGKSKYLIDLISESHIDENTKYLVFKPTKDIRDGLFVKSRAYNKKIKAFAWDQNDSNMQKVFKYIVAGFSLTNPDNKKNLFIDEVQFLSLENVSFIYECCKQFDINVFFCGLETDFRLKTFEVADWLKHVCNKYVFLNGICCRCGKEKAVYNLILDKDGIPKIDGPQLQPEAKFDVMCKDCYDEIIL